MCPFAPPSLADYASERASTRMRSERWGRGCARGGQGVGMCTRKKHATKPVHVPSCLLAFATTAARGTAGPLGRLHRALCAPYHMLVATRGYTRHTSHPNQPTSGATLPVLPTPLGPAPAAPVHKMGGPWVWRQSTGWQHSTQHTLSCRGWCRKCRGCRVRCRKCRGWWCLGRGLLCVCKDGHHHHATSTPQRMHAPGASTDAPTLSV